MSIIHKFQNHDNFKNGFKTNNSILSTVPYDPEVIFIGTFNHGWSWNNSDFFYGRDMYMWTIMANMFLYNKNTLIKRRNQNNNVPSLPQIFEICSKGKIVFADIVKGIKEEIPSMEMENNKCVLVNNQYRWETRIINKKTVGEYSDTHLDNLAQYDWLDDNVEAIIKYINDSKSIKHIYFTFKSGTWLVKKLNEIKHGVRKDVKSCSIFTPTANGFRRNLANPFHERAWGLTHCWVWNGLNHHVPINKSGYGHLDHDWLKRNGVNPNNF